MFYNNLADVDYLMEASASKNKLKSEKAFHRNFIICTLVAAYKLITV